MLLMLFFLVAAQVFLGPTILPFQRTFLKDFDVPAWCLAAFEPGKPIQRVSLDACMHGVRTFARLA
jgi:hypothetical protein